MPWRPLPVDRAAQDPRPVAASLGRLAASLGAPPPKVLGAVFSHWERVVGPDVAAHAQPVSLRDGVLVIAADHPAWASQLTYLQDDLLRQVQAAAGSEDVIEVQVRVANPGRSRRAR